jgi:hypothetical protein
MDMRFGTWNISSFYRARSTDNTVVAKEIA